MAQPLASLLDFPTSNPSFASLPQVHNPDSISNPDIPSSPTNPLDDSSHPVLPVEDSADSTALNPSPSVPPKLPSNIVPPAPLRKSSRLSKPPSYL